MNQPFEFLVRHGAAVLFVVVSIEQIGLRVPAALCFLAAGALTGTGSLNWLVALGASAFGSIVADRIWSVSYTHLTLPTTERV